MATPAAARELVFGAIADDLTGGIELASMLVARGVRTGFSIGADAPIAAGSDAHVIALKTRVIAAPDAVAQALAAAERLIRRGTRQFFFKYCATFDSTPAGNIGPCAEALMQRLGTRQAMFVPALCETGRTTYQGHMFGGSQLLSESPKRLDPLTPMTDSNLVRVLQAQSRAKAGLVPYGAVDAGPGAIRAHLETLAGEEVALVVADTLVERHLEAIARAAADAPFLTGNSSVAAHLPPVWFERGLISPSATIELPAVGGPGAVVAGSVAPQTLLQLNAFSRTNPVLTLDLERAFAGDDVVEEALAFARTAISAGRDAGVSTAVTQAEVDRLQARFGRAPTAARAEAVLAEIVRRLVVELDVRRLVVAGGETSGAAVGALGLEEIAVGPYLGLGMSRGVATVGARRLALALKSGKLGPTGVFASMLSAMRQPLHIAPALDIWPPEQPTRHA